jgi:hypothetical protein
MINWKDVKINYNSIGHRFEVSPDSVGVGPLLKNALESGEGCVSHFYQEGYADKAFEKMQDKIVELKGRKVYETISSSSSDCFYIWDDAFVEVSYTRSKLMTISSVSTNPEITNVCKEVAAMFSTPQKRGYVFAITRNHQGGLQLTRIGYAGAPIERGNYIDEVCRDYDYIVDDLHSKDPMGRVIILDGPAGTGKSHMIRGILMDAPKAMFVIVPPNMVASIGGPELIPLLLRTKEDYGKKGPIVLVLEDADQCLAPRQADNMSSISSILNLGDGLLGSIFDVRILATTNAKAKELDEGIIRDMRLSKQISIQPHGYDKADRIYKRLLKDDSQFLPKPKIVERDMMKPMINKKTFTLAEIYKAARIGGWKPEKNAEQTPEESLHEELKALRFHPEDMEDSGEQYL